MLVIYSIWLVCASLIALWLYGTDKKRAMKNRPRRKESTLLGFAACGGAVGATLGRLLFRHKTNKAYFSVVIYFSLVVQVGVLIFLAVLGGLA